MSMELTIYREAGMWSAHVGGKYEFEVKEIHPLVPDKGSLLFLVRAIQSVYPDAKVWIDPHITDNPFLSNKLFVMKYYGMLPIYEEVQKCLDHPESKICTICGSKAWYDINTHRWTCWACKAVEAYDQFVRIRRFRK